MAEYKLDTIPREVLANLTRVMAKYPSINVWHKK